MLKRGRPSGKHLHFVPPKINTFCEKYENQFTDKCFGEKGVTDLGDTPPPPFTDKIRKVVFDVFP